MTSQSQDQIRKPGTMVIADDGFSTRIGQVADITTDRWGTWHVVAIARDGEDSNPGEVSFETVGTIRDAGAKGIGWKVATQDEVRRHRVAC